MFHKNAISHYKNPKLFTPVVHYSSLHSCCKNAIHFFRVNSNLERELPEAYTCCWKKPKEDNKY